MSVKSWPPIPSPPPEDFEDSPGAGWNPWYVEVVKNKTCCKHGDGECEICGTTNRRDTKHKTVGGKGLIARIKGRRT